MNNDEEFIQGLYDEADKELQRVYKKQKENRDELLKGIALVMLTYNVLNGSMSLNKNDKNKEYKRLSTLIIGVIKGQQNVLNDTLTNLLNNTIKNTFNFYNYNPGLKDVEKIINSNFKGKHFSERIWENENEVAKRLHKQVDNFLKGKVNVNQIKKDIERTYNSSAYNAKRLVETEIARVENDSFKRFCEETGVRKIRRNAVLDNRTCNDCSSYNGKVYELKDATDLPAHPLCRCFYEIVDEYYKQPLVMNLQLFGFDEKRELQKLIDDGTINKEKYNKCYNYFNDKFKKGILTPIGIVYNRKDGFVHIARRHNYMVSEQQINNIIDNLTNPDSIFKTVDKFGNIADGYIKNINNKELLTIVRNDIITSYYPSKNYIKKIKEGELIWERK